MVSSAKIEMTASVFMASMVDFECGQKRQCLAHFQDDPGELGGVLRDARIQRRERTRNSSINLGASRQNARRRMMTGLWLCGGPVLVPVGLDIQQREGAEHAGRIGRRGLMQVGLVEFAEGGRAEQPQAADHLVLE